MRPTALGERPLGRLPGAVEEGHRHRVAGDDRVGEGERPLQQRHVVGARLVEELDDALGPRLGGSNLDEPAFVGDPLTGGDEDDVAGFELPAGELVGREEGRPDPGRAGPVGIALDGDP